MFYVECILDFIRSRTVIYISFIWRFVISIYSEGFEEFLDIFYLGFIFSVRLRIRVRCSLLFWFVFL